MCIRDRPAPDTPYNATRLGRLIAERTDIPPGVINVVTASDHLVGEELTLSPKVDLISFTGSTAVGKRIMAVSYTHLRAHETPEHLVCRLLLEKKKKTKA